MREPLGGAHPERNCTYYCVSGQTEPTGYPTRGQNFFSFLFHHVVPLSRSWAPGRRPSLLGPELRERDPRSEYLRRAVNSIENSYIDHISIFHAFLRLFMAFPASRISTKIIFVPHGGSINFKTDFPFKRAQSNCANVNLRKYEPLPPKKYSFFCFKVAKNMEIENRNSFLYFPHFAETTETKQLARKLPWILKYNFYEEHIKL